MNESTQRELERRFTYHKPGGNQAERYKTIRAAAYGLAALLVDRCPESRELSIALTHLDEVVMFANAAIARRENPSEEPNACAPSPSQSP